METSITYLKEQFQLKDPDIRSYSPLTLAYIGDGIYELYIRTILIDHKGAGLYPADRRTRTLQPGGYKGKSCVYSKKTGRKDEYSAVKLPVLRGR